MRKYSIKTLFSKKSKKIIPISSSPSKKSTPVSSRKATPASSRKATPMSSKKATPMSSKKATPASSRNGTPASSRNTSLLELNGNIFINESEYNKMIKIFEEKYDLKKYMEVVNLEQNDNFKKFLNTMIFYYNEHPLPKLYIKKTKFNKIQKIEIEAVDKLYDINKKYPLSNYIIVNYIFYTIYIIVKNLNNGFVDIENKYKNKFTGKQLEEALLFNKTDKYNALSNYAHILLYMIFYNTSFMPKYLQKYFKDIFKISRKGDNLVKDCDDSFIKKINEKLFVCNYPDKPKYIEIKVYNGIKKLFNNIADYILINESLELSEKLLK